MPKKKGKEAPEEELLVLHEKWVEAAKKHLRELIALALIIVLAAVGWAMFQYQRERQETKASLLYARAEMSRKSGQEKFLKEVIRRYGGTSAALQARMDLFDSYYQKGEIDKALSEIEAIKKRAKGDMKTFVTLGEGYLFEEKRDWAKARADYEKAARANIGLEYLAWLDLARVSELSGDLDKAVQYYREFIGLKPQGNILDFVEVQLSKLEAKLEERKE